MSLALVSGAVSHAPAAAQWPRRRQDRTLQQHSIAQSQQRNALSARQHPGRDMYACVRASVARLDCWAMYCDKGELGKWASKRAGRQASWQVGEQALPHLSCSSWLCRHSPWVMYWLASACNSGILNQCNTDTHQLSTSTHSRVGARRECGSGGCMFVETRIGWFFSTRTRPLNHPPTHRTNEQTNKQNADACRLAGSLTSKASAVEW